VSVDWATIRPRLIEVFTDLALEPMGQQVQAYPGTANPYTIEVPPFQVNWRERNDNTAPIHLLQEMAVDLKVTTVVGVGGDEWRYEMRDVPNADPPRQDLYEIVCGLRRFTLNVKVTVAEEQDSRWAFSVIERIRTRLYFSRSFNRMLEVGVDITDVLNGTDATFTSDKVRWSCATLDVVMTAVVNEVDTIPTGWIERIIWTSHIQDGGVDLPEPPNFTNEMLPPE